MDAACASQAHYIKCEYPAPMRLPGEAIHEGENMWVKTRPLSYKAVHFLVCLHPIWEGPFEVVGKQGNTLWFEDSDSHKARNPKIAQETSQSAPPPCVEPEHGRVIACDPADLSALATSPTVSPHGRLALPRCSCLQSCRSCLRQHQHQPGGEKSSQRPSLPLADQSSCRKQPVLPSPLLVPPSAPATAEAG
ncbi:hypothetical protein PR048_008098 [Dryococelus australis]|uniref:Uncharacterized protein n=1 Tax=Dryococelus australis TaxID=614101 RepID=A0ABQ9HWY0_9NEOP|nr:hypothetical protein PR048_008098 [Dryococelus australis]